MKEKFERQANDLSPNLLPDSFSVFTRVSLRVMFDLLTEVSGKLPGDSLMLDLLARFEIAFRRIFPNAEPPRLESFKASLWRMLIEAHYVAPLDNPADLQKKLHTKEGPIFYGTVSPRRRPKR